MSQSDNKLIARRFLEEVVTAVEQWGGANAFEALLEIGAIRLPGPEQAG